VSESTIERAVIIAHPTEDGRFALTFQFTDGSWSKPAGSYATVQEACDHAFQGARDLNTQVPIEDWSKR
jgi:hypothetical protein